MTPAPKGRPIKVTLHANEYVIHAAYLRGCAKVKALLAALNEKRRDG